MFCHGHRNICFCLLWWRWRLQKGQWTWFESKDMKHKVATALGRKWLIHIQNGSWLYEHWWTLQVHTGSIWYWSVQMATLAQHCILYGEVCPVCWMHSVLTKQFVWEEIHKNLTAFCQCKENIMVIPSL